MLEDGDGGDVSEGLDRRRESAGRIARVCAWNRLSAPTTVPRRRIGSAWTERKPAGEAGRRTGANRLDGCRGPADDRPPGQEAIEARALLGLQLEELQTRMVRSTTP